MPASEQHSESPTTRDCSVEIGSLMDRLQRQVTVITWRSSLQGRTRLQGHTQRSKPEPHNCRHRTTHTHIHTHMPTSPYSLEIMRSHTDMQINASDPHLT